MKYYPVIMPQMDKYHTLIAVAQGEAKIEGKKMYYEYLFRVKQKTLEEYRIRLDDVTAEYLNTNYMVFLWSPGPYSLGIGRAIITGSAAVCTDRYRGWAKFEETVSLVRYFVEMAQPEQKVESFSPMLDGLLRK